MKKICVLMMMMLPYSALIAQHSIFATISGGDLYSFNLTNCTRQFIGSTGQGFGDIAFTPDGRLWGIVSGELYQIDTSTAIATLIGNTGIGSITLVGLNDSTLLAELGTDLYGINANNATSYYIDHIGYGASGDLTWYDDDLYMTTPVIRIVLNSTYTAILSVTNLNSSVPTCEGAVTALFAGDYNSIVGFNGPNLYKICQIDGSYEMLCPSLNVGGTPGAASIRLTTQIPEPTLCHIPTSIDNHFSNLQFEISPNPTTTSLNITYTIHQPATLTITNTYGTTVKQLTLYPYFKNRIVYIDDLPAGIYLITLHEGNKISSKKIIVER